MTNITIPKNLVKDDLILVPRKEYEELIRVRLKNVREVELTLAQRRALFQARKNLARGKFLTVHELKQKLGSKNR